MNEYIGLAYGGIVCTIIPALIVLGLSGELIPYTKMVINKVKEVIKK